jgi:D-serine deaminase-like pyridoxal phosphate-dependent protein
VSPWSAAKPGDPVTAIDTPALVLDLDAFERNLERMQQALQGSGVRLRAHAKAHKCPDIALRQVAQGAIGICCQKVSEAAVFVDAGVRDVLVTNEVVGEAKLHHLCQLARKAKVGVLVDHLPAVDALAAAARTHGVEIDVYVEVDVGGNRCGVAPGEAALNLASQITASPPLRFAGLHCYHGSAQHLRAPEERAAAIAEAVRLTRETVEHLETFGIPVNRVTGAGTASFVHERDSKIFNEVQAGSYAFMDRDYADNRYGPGDVQFEHALFVRTTVMSRPTPTRAIVDAGLKASSVDSGMPRVWQRNDLKYVKASDEHGVVETPNAEALSHGDTLMLIPGHCDPTFNLYDEVVCIRGDRVEAVWPIAARGALL